ncbi:MAG: transporter substrate-binding protein, partial [Dehalococcoidia bacterium]|nr:transporter substrate-binding protein [Dehalococcoidia bacterium]
KFPQYEHPKSQATIDKARKLLADAGYEKGFELQAIKTTTDEQLIIAQAQIEKALPGVKIKINPLDNAIRQNRAVNGDFQIDSYGTIHETNGVAQFSTFMYSKGGRNHAFLRDAKMDKLIEDASLELDTEKRTAMLREAQRYFLELAPYIPLQHYYSQLAVQPWVRGINPGPATNFILWTENVWFTSPPKR